VSPEPEVFTVVVYSDDVAVREQVRLAVGPRPDADLRVEYVDAGSQAEVVAVVDRGGVDLCILDGEAWPAGGMGLARQLKAEIRDCPPCIVLTGRRDDAWLAKWSQADGVLTRPLDPFEAVAVTTRLLRARAGLLSAAPDQA